LAGVPSKGFEGEGRWKKGGTAPGQFRGKTRLWRKGSNAIPTVFGLSEEAEDPSEKKTTSTKAPKERAKKAPKAKTKKPSALDAAVRVLTETGMPMTCPEMITAMATKGYWTSPVARRRRPPFIRGSLSILGEREKIPDSQRQDRRSSV
jgi:hypothetical protein